jgi:hypothetical protein
VANFSNKFAPYIAANEKAPPPAVQKGAAPHLQITSADASWHRVASVGEVDSIRSAAVAAGEASRTGLAD